MHLLSNCVFKMKNFDTNEQGEIASGIFAAVFSKKPGVSTKRLAILRSINKCSSGKMKFREILKEVQSLEDFQDLISQKLAYDLRILKRNKLIDKTPNGEYTITTYGYYLLDVYDGIAHRLDETLAKEKPDIAGEASGLIVVDAFDHKRLADELSLLPFFRKRLSFKGNKVSLEWKDNSDDFKSEIEISPDGSFAVRVLLYKDSSEAKVELMEGAGNDDEWCEMARGIVQAIVYYIKKCTHKIWKDSKIVIPLKPDAYPLNAFQGS